MTVANLYGQILLLARLVGELARTHRPREVTIEGVYPWAPLQAMLWWAIRHATSPTSASAALTEDGEAARDAAQSREFAVRLLYVVMIATLSAITFPLALGVALFVYGNGGAEPFRWVIALALAVTLGIGLGTWLEAHVRLTHGLPASAPSATRVAFPLVAAVLTLGALGWLSDRASFAGADLAGLDLRAHDLRRADLSGANLTAALLERAHLEEANLRNATLALAVLRDAYLEDADLSDADLRGAKLRGADLQRAQLTGARLDRADFTDALVEGVEWDDARGERVAVTETAIAPCPPGRGKDGCCVDFDRGRPQPAAAGCAESLEAVACIWLHSGTSLESVPSWVRERLPTVPTYDQAEKCSDERHAGRAKTRPTVDAGMPPVDGGAR